MSAYLFNGVNHQWKPFNKTNYKVLWKYTNKVCFRQNIPHRKN